MKKFTLTMFAATAAVCGFSQNLIQNPGFEATVSTFTVEETGANVLMRVANHQDATVQTAAPTATAVAVTDGMWVKKSPNSGYIKGVVRTDLTNPGSSSPNSVLNLRHNQNNATSGLTNWYQCVAQQQIAGGVDLTKTYVLTFDAKVDDETSPTLSNICDQVVAVIRDIVNNVQTTQTINLTQGTTWHTYTATFNLPTWIAGGGSTANGANVIFGLGIKTEYDENSKTKYSSVLIDNVSLVDNSQVGLSEIGASRLSCIAQNGTIQITNAPQDAAISVYDIAGKVVAEGKTSIQVQKGLYIVKVGGTTQKVLVQ